MENGGIKKSGLYWIMPLLSKTKIQVFCDMENEGGGWTLFLNYHFVRSKP